MTVISCSLSRTFIRPKNAPLHMQALFQEIQSFIRYQQELYGNIIPLDSPATTATTPQIVTPTLPATASQITSPFERIEALIAQDSPLKPMKTLAEVEAFVAQTVLIDIDKTRKNPVFGSGNPNAKLMVIGEAPGANEDQTGAPFVGEAGQLLTKILGAVGFERDHIYITNILKSRPPHNRDPQPDEIQAHIPILERGTRAHRFLPFTLTKMQTQPMMARQRFLLPLLHGLRI